MSNKYSFLAVSTVICALALSSQSVLAQTTVFDDTFNNGSTIDQVPTAPTANSASYEVAGNQTLGVAPSINPGDLNITQNNTGSAFTEMMAQFTGSPIVLSQTGDTIDLTVTFVDTLRILASGDAGSQLQIGLFNSGGVAPLQGAMNLNSGATFATGGAQNWLGFYGRDLTSGTGQIAVRAPQSGGNGSDQDLLFNNASSGVAFDNPPGEVLGQKSGVATTLTQGTTNTFEIRMTLTSPTSMEITNTLYAGADTSGTVLYSLDATTNGVINSLDALAFGFRFSGTKTNAMIDVQQIMVTDDIAAVPEPSSIALAAAGFGLMLGLIRRRRS